jgi:phosphoribosyl-ATP pyrophosphohydrolase/phosphoribosyl-AMP cyclohydrolase
MADQGFLESLEAVIRQRMENAPEGSYTASLAAKGISKVAQKVGEEGVELALAGVVEPDDRVIAESADLIYHLIVLLNVRGIPLSAVFEELEARHRDKATNVK